MRLNQSEVSEDIDNDTHTHRETMKLQCDQTKRVQQKQRTPTI